MKLTYKLLDVRDVLIFKALMNIFSEEFNDKDTYQRAKPDEK